MWVMASQDLGLYSYDLRLETLESSGVGVRPLQMKSSNLSTWPCSKAKKDARKRSGGLWRAPDCLKGFCEKIQFPDVLLAERGTAATSQGC